MGFSSCPGRLRWRLPSGRIQRPVCRSPGEIEAGQEAGPAGYSVAAWHAPPPRREAGGLALAYKEFYPDFELMAAYDRLRSARQFAVRSLPAMRL
jgi:hypothetical protein